MTSYTKYACSQNTVIFNSLLADMRVHAQKIENSTFVPNPRHCYEIKIMEADGK